MWNFGMYEWLANERIATYRREASQDRLGLDAARPRRDEKPAPVASSGGTPEIRGAQNEVPAGRRALAAAFVGLAAMSVLRRRR